MTSVLARIEEAVRTRLELRQQRRSLSSLQTMANSARVARSLRAALLMSRPSFIAEVKFKSPSEGLLCQLTDPVAVAQGYLENGATALSILTEEDHFGGSLEFLARVREAYPSACLLMKDFVVSEYQILEGKLAGADACLLMLSLLGEKRVGELLEFCKRNGLEALVEVHDEAEMEAADRIRAEIIGVNNRDLKTLKVSLDVSRRLIERAPQGAVLVCESGIASGSEVLELHGRGYSSFLVGSSLMKTGAPGLALRRLREGATS